MAYILPAFSVDLAAALLYGSTVCWLLYIYTCLEYIRWFCGIAANNGWQQSRNG